MARKKRRGRHCWVCGRTRPNEEFSGGGHHVCRECKRLGPEELAPRQVERHVDSALDRLRGRRRFERLTQLASSGPERGREYARAALAALAAEREEWRAAIALDELQVDADAERYAREAEEHDREHALDDLIDSLAAEAGERPWVVDRSDEEIPF